jgi:hypothetical protein
LPRRWGACGAGREGVREAAVTWNAIPGIIVLVESRSLTKGGFPTSYRMCTKTFGGEKVMKTNKAGARRPGKIVVVVTNAAPVR